MNNRSVFNHRDTEGTEVEPPTQREIQGILEHDVDLSDLCACLLQWKASGLTQEICYEAVSEFRKRQALDEHADDLVIEWLDVISGHCGSHLKVW